MRFIVKVLIVVGVILTCAQIAKVRPTLAGLIAVMPLTGLLVMLWVYSDCGGDVARMNDYTLGAVWGIVPAILFFVGAYVCFRYRLHLAWVLGISFGLWLAGALVHQYLLGKS